MKTERRFADTYNSIFSDCDLCPRACHADRLSGETGYCGMDSGYNIASVCIHTGEEPAIGGEKGICNIFFSGCNLRCLYCQNHYISKPGSACRNDLNDPVNLLDRIEEILSRGIKSVGFVSPSHVVPQVKSIIEGLRTRGLSPVTVYNTNSYDKVETIRDLSGFIDVYLPDYKYITPVIAADFSDAPDYPEIAFKAIKEMYYQKGSVLQIDNDGIAENGLLIRHLVLPGHAEESKKILRKIAEELSPGIHLSLMSQYHPTICVKEHRLLNRTLYPEEYEDVVKEMELLGFRNGWVQEIDSYRNYRPDFSKEHPFE